ncbi:MAG: flagellar basal body P-ring protein FlgI [Planctomycetaceae bacterium]
MHRAPRRYVVVLCLAMTGCQQFNVGTSAWNAFRLGGPAGGETSGDDDLFSAPNETGVSVNTSFVGDYGTVEGLNVVAITGVGLVVGLKGTGGDPPPSMYRNLMLDEMRRRGVANPNAVLASPDTAVVAIKAYLPPLVRKGEKFDIEVSLPDTGEATSLNGGYLLETRLSEQAIVPGRGVIDGHEFAKAEGPILISTGEGDEGSLAGVLRRGRVLGGATSLKDRHMAFYLRHDFRSARNAKRLATRIGQRFYSLNEHGIREPLAEAKTDQQVELKIHPRYKENFPRYIQIVRAVSFNETPVAERIRLQQLKDRLHDPEESERAAFELEAIGTNAIDTLKGGLDSRRLEVRFHSAAALAYLGRDDGVPQLAEAARVEPAFRVYALAALAVLERSAAPRHLRELMSEPSSELRYGSFRALSTLNPGDSFIRGETLNDAFRLHVLDTAGEPMVHLTHKAKQEIVLFGAGQLLKTPITVRAGNQIHVTGHPGSETITVSRYDRGIPVRKEVSTRLVDVIRAAAECGATYPDIAQMLIQAEKGHNLEGRIEIDALPRAGREYLRPKDGLAQVASRTTRIGRGSLAPNLFALEEGEGGDTTASAAAGAAGGDGGWAGDDADFASAETKSDRDAKKQSPKRSDMLLRPETPWYDVRKYFLDPKTP